MPDSDARIALISSRFRDGGVERWMRRLARGLHDAGRQCDLVLGELGEQGVELPAQAIWTPRGRESFPALLRRYVRGVATAILCPFRTADYSDVMRVAARIHQCHRVCLVSGAFISQRISASQAGLVRAWKQRWRLHHTWSRAGALIAVSPTVRDDWVATGALPAEGVHAPPPPVVGDDVLEASTASLDHPWLGDSRAPVVLGVGRLHRDKCFDRLVTAVECLRRRIDVRLIILGEGDQRDALTRQAADLGISNAVDLPGFVDNPYSWMRAADAVIVPSRVETFGFVLIEAMYVGTPFVADRSPPGPRSIHASTGQGLIADCSDADALAGAIEGVLAVRPPADALHEAAAPYETAASVRQYLAILDSLGGS